MLNENLHYPKMGMRAVEAIIDYFVFYAFFLAYLFGFGEPDSSGEVHMSFIEVLPIPAFWFIYFALMEGLTGQTLGKKIIGVRVVKQGGGWIGIGRAAARRLFDMVDLTLAGLVGYLVMRNSPNRQRIGDLIAKAVVIEDRSAVCNQCQQRFTLDDRDLTLGQFTCPDCRQENTS